MPRLASLATAAVAVAVVGTTAVGATVVITGGAAPLDPAASTPTASGSRGTPAMSSAPSSTGPSTTPRVAPLRRIIVPDLLVVSRESLSEGAVAAVRKVRGVREVTRMAAGRARVHGRRLSLLGVDPSTFRFWTPPPSAESNALWRALAYDQLVLSFHATKASGLRLGRRYDVVGTRPLSLRVGAIAGLGLPRVDGLVTMASAHGLGLVDGAGLLVNAPSARIGTLVQRVRRIVGSHARVVNLRAKPPGQSNASRAPAGRPRTYRELYQQAAGRCPGLSWTVLAAIGQVESGHGRNLGPSSAGARGPMQFLPSTWRRWGVDGDGDGSRDINDPYDAVPAAADYLCYYGAGQGRDALADAVFAYNHSESYVRTVLVLAEAYARGS